MDKVLWIILIITIIIFIHVVANFIFIKVIKNKVKKRKETIFLLFITFIKYSSVLVGFFLSLTLFGIDPSSVLAGAGVLGILLGFGMQKLVQDIVNGFFIIYENQYVTGEFVSLNNISGEVIELGLKTTKLLTYKGEMHYIPNGQITSVINFTRTNSLATIEISILNENNLKYIYSIIEESLKNYSNPSVINQPEIKGLSQSNELSYVVRITCITKPYEHFAIEREIRTTIIKALQKSGVIFL